MLDDIGASVASYVVAAVGDGVTARFDRPGDGEAGAVHIVLHDLRRLPAGRGSDRADVRDDEGRVIARQGAAVPVLCCYLVVSDSGDAREDHRRLGRLLRAGIDDEVLPDEHRIGGLVDIAEPIELEVAPADPPSPERRADVLGAGVGFALELRLTVPVRPSPLTEIAPAAEEIDLSLERRVPPVPPLPGTGPADREWRTYRVREPT